MGSFTYGTRDYMLCLKKTMSCIAWSDQYEHALCEAVTKSNKAMIHVQFETPDCTG